MPKSQGPRRQQHRSRTTPAAKAAARARQPTVRVDHRSSFRRAVERRSAAPVVFLRSLPHWLVMLVMLVVLGAGMFTRGPFAAVMLLLVGTFLAWIAFLSWPASTLGGRILRVVAVAIVLGAAIGKLLGYAV